MRPALASKPVGTPKPTLNANLVECNHVYGIQELTWRGDALMCDRRRLAKVVRDRQHAGMWRVSIGGGLSDMANETRARDAALSLALAALNRRYDAEETAAKAPPVEQSGTEAAPC